MVFTSYEKNYVIHHMTICGNTLCGYTSDPKFAEQAFYKHIQDILKKDNAAWSDAKRIAIVNLDDV